ncbi:hypothetical protein RSAG8_01071, partial [Rhizoctonia solani AG-8 WAC10335]
MKDSLEPCGRITSGDILIKHVDHQHTGEKVDHA